MGLLRQVNPLLLVSVNGGTALHPKVLLDVKSSDGTLSFFLVEENDTTQALRVAFALACLREKFADLNYVIVPDATVQALGLAMDEEEGNTADSEVNKWHRNLHASTADRLLAVARVIVDCPPSPTVRQNVIIPGVWSGIRAGQINPEKINLSSELSKLKPVVKQLVGELNQLPINDIG